MKTLSFVVPCYNSAVYLDRCVETLLAAEGDDYEIILVNDGSSDTTPALCDAYAARYPQKIQVIHQQNRGHGGAINAGLAAAQGFYFKVVDSDDWLDPQALEQVMVRLREFAQSEAPVDMVITNYVYEHLEDNTRKVMRYDNVFFRERIISWKKILPFLPSQYLLMHSVIYRKTILHTSGLQLPEHTFYVDNLFVYQPLPLVQSIFYIDTDFYRYSIGRADQSINEKVMIKQIDQQIRVTRLMMEALLIRDVKKTSRRLAWYMRSYLSMMVSICSIFLIIQNTPESLAKRRDLWAYLRSRDPALWFYFHFRLPSAWTCFPGALGRRFSIWLYRNARKVYKFN